MILNSVVVKVLEPFLADFGSSHHGSEIARRCGLNQKTVANTLNNLEKEGWMESKIRGRNKDFTLRLNDREKITRFILSVENARTLLFLDKNQKVKEIFGKIKGSAVGIVVVFGSYAKGAQKKDSDLDLFIAGECDITKINRISELYGLKVSVKQMTSGDFLKALKSRDIFIKEVVSNHIIIQGLEEYIEEVMVEYYGR